MNRRSCFFAFVILMAIIILYGCSKESKGVDNNNGDTNKDFKIAMLTNYANNIIIPAYTDLHSKLDLLDVSVNTFLTAPSDATQLTLKTIFKNAYVSYE